MQSKMLFVLLVISLVLCPVLSTLVVEEAGLRVVFPTGYRKRYDLALADFGEARYGGSLMGTLYYPSSEKSMLPPGQEPIKCYPEDCQYACQPFNESKPALALPKNPGRLNILLVDRGPKGSSEPCYFLTKAWNAQQAGADALIVVNDVDGELSTAIVPDDDKYSGVLPKLTISAGMVSKLDGDFLKSLLKNGPVTLALNWSNIIPRKKQVAWELWTNSNDECGTICNEQRAFISGMRTLAKTLEQQNLTSFSPHYLMWTCPAEYMTSEDCRTQCIFNGTYCAPDPDNDVYAGYSGSDVLLMNVRQLCFFRLAKATGQPALWWDYTDMFGTNCTMATKQYTAECAEQVFKSVGGPALNNSQGQQSWDACINNVTAGLGATNKTTLDILEQELAAQHGSVGQSTVSIIPTVRVNGQQFRGTLDVAGVVRALCSAFPLNSEPSVCNEKWVSDNECEASGVGYSNCKVGDPAANGNTRCVNTFGGYRCECGQGWVKTADSVTGDDVCEDLNECLATNIPLTDPSCSCERCACINSIGGYKCTGPLPNKCTAEFSYGGCWTQVTWDRNFSACVDAITDYKRLAARGRLDGSSDWVRCQCPGCFQGDGNVQRQKSCQIKCDLQRCVGNPGQNFCLPDDAPSPAPGGTAGVGAGGVFWIVVLTIACTAGLGYAAMRLVQQRQMMGEMRNIMGQYLPLQTLEGDYERAPLMSSTDASDFAEATPARR